jgi:transposase-like protein
MARTCLQGKSNRRTGTSGKVPSKVSSRSDIRRGARDRDGSFKPELVKEGQTRIDGMDDKIVHRRTAIAQQSAERRALRRRAECPRHPRPS